MHTPDPLSHINNFSKFLDEILEQKEEGMEQIIAKMQQYGIVWDNNEVRLLIQDARCTPKQKFLILLSASRIIEPDHGFWVLLEHLFEKTILSNNGDLDHPGVIGAWIKRNLSRYESWMDISVIREIKSRIKYTFWIHENWYIAEQVTKSVDSIINERYHDLIVITCRFLTHTYTSKYITLWCQSILKLAKLWREDWERYISRYKSGKFPGIDRLEKILNHLWNDSPDLSILSSSDVVSLLSLYK